MIADVGAAGAAFFPVGAEHEVVDEELAVGADEIGEGDFAVGGVEGVVFVDARPGELAARGGELVVEAGEVFFFGEKGIAGFEPFLLRYNFWFGHDFSWWKLRISGGDFLRVGECAETRSRTLWSARRDGRR